MVINATNMTLSNPFFSIDNKIRLSRFVLTLGLIIAICCSLYCAISVHNIHTDLGTSTEIHRSNGRSPLLDLSRFSNPRIAVATQHAQQIHTPVLIDISTYFHKKVRRYRYSPDYGGLQIHFLNINDTKARIVVDNLDNERGHIFDSGDGDDWIHPYYAFDDDSVRHQTCRRVSWYRYQYQNCNTFHEIPLFRVPIVNHGYYRDVFNYTHDFVPSSASSLSIVILKKMRYEHEATYDNFEYVRMDALVMERLTTSPRIANIFGHCGTSILQQAFEADVQDIIVPGSGYLKHHSLNDTLNTDSQNSFSPSQKLKIALDLAEPIADLHGFKDGVIIHNDIQLCQYLYTKDNKLTLNDFNRAEIMLWDENKQQYCKYKNGKAWGNVRSPEEYEDNPLDEKLDVYSYGNLIYSLLTGLWNFYNLQDDEVVQKAVVNGDRAFIDPRYRNETFAESALVNLIEKCWTSNPSERPSIFHVIDYLKQALVKDIEIRRNIASSKKKVST